MKGFRDKAFIAAIVFILGLSTGLILAQPHTATIVGKVYVDSNRNLALDYGDTPADGFTIILQSLERKEKTPSLSLTKVDEVVVNKGEYRFLVKKGGEYMVTILLDKPPYNAGYYTGENTFKIEVGKIIMGPTILIGQAAVTEK